MNYETPKKKIHIYCSLEEQAEAEAEQVAKQPPLQRIKETVELILRVYGVTQKELNERERSNHIHITQYK